jgi:hypothetical protein
MGTTVHDSSPAGIKVIPPLALPFYFPTISRTCELTRNRAVTGHYARSSCIRSHLPAIRATASARTAIVSPHGHRTAPRGHKFGPICGVSSSLSAGPCSQIHVRWPRCSPTDSSRAMRCKNRRMATARRRKRLTKRSGGYSTAARRLAPVEWLLVDRWKCPSPRDCVRRLRDRAQGGEPAGTRTTPVRQACYRPISAH